MAMTKWLIIFLLVALALWLATAPKVRGGCPHAGTAACQCGRTNRVDDLMSRA